MEALVPAGELTDVVMYIPSEEPRLRLKAAVLLTVYPLFLHSLLSLISNSLNLLFGSQGRSRRLTEAHFLQKRNGEHGEDLYQGLPHRILLFQVFLLPAFPLNQVPAILLLKNLSCLPTALRSNSLVWP